MRYRSKPQEVEAVQWDGYHLEPLYDYLGDDLSADVLRATGHGLELRAGKDGAQGWVPVPDGHWIVRKPGDFTDYWPVDPDYFAAKYEPADG